MEELEPEFVKETASAIRYMATNEVIFELCYLPIAQLREQSDRELSAERIEELHAQFLEQTAEIWKRSRYYYLESLEENSPGLAALLDEAIPGDLPAL